MKQMSKMKILIIVLILMIIAIILILNTLDKNDNDKQVNNSEVVYETAKPEQDENVYIPDISVKEYFIVKNCINKYLSVLNFNSSNYYGYNENGEFVDVTDESEKKKNVYDLISKEYAETKGITADNILENIETVNQNKLVVPLEILKKDDSESIISEYYVKSLIISVSNSKEHTQNEFLVYVDYENNTFSIVPENVELEVNEAIDVNNSNEVMVKTKITEIDIVKEYGTNYKNIMLSNIDEAYERLNEDYRNKRFPTKEIFAEYVEQNRNILETMNFEQYELTRKNGIYQYCCVDQYENFYIINEKGTFEYDVMLDYYTIDIPQFTEKYNVASDTEKIVYNIQKCLDAMNNDDYAYMYSKLSENFINNNYPTEKEFKEFMVQNLFDKNVITDISAELEGEVYVCDVTISNKNNTEETKKITVIMQLNEGTDFVMSFNVE